MYGPSVLSRTRAPIVLFSDRCVYGVQVYSDLNHLRSVVALRASIKKDQALRARIRAIRLPSTTDRFSLPERLHDLEDLWDNMLVSRNVSVLMCFQHTVPGRPVRARWTRHVCYHVRRPVPVRCALILRRVRHLVVQISERDSEDSDSDSTKQKNTKVNTT